jgi:hypothetical protein
MAIMLMLLSYVAAFGAFVFHSVKHRNAPHWRESLIATHLCWAVTVLLSTEILSLFHAVGPGPVTVLWAALFMAAAMAAFGTSRGVAFPALQRVSRIDGILIAVLCCFAVLLAVIGILAPPNTWDAMTYHLPRIMHWVQNHSVNHYYTHIDRQLFDPPWSEFAMLHGYLLSGTDHLSALVQCSSYCICSVVASRIAASLGASRRGQVAAAALFASLPMAVLQGSSTQNDLNAAMWLLCIIHFVIASKKHSTTGLGASVGLALATKPTACLFALPFLIWYAWSSAQTFGRSIWRTWAIIAGIAVILPIGHFGRNLAWYGSPFSPAYYSRENTNASFSASAIAANTLRDISGQINTPLAGVNHAIQAGLVSLFGIMRLDINDPGTTYPYTNGFTVRKPSADEDLAGNPIHLLLGIAALLFFACQFKKVSDQHSVAYLASLTGGFFIFCLVIRWNPWNSRYLLPLAAATAVWVALIFDRALRPRALAAVALVCVAAATPWALYNGLRPVIGGKSVFVSNRTEIRFAKRPYLIDPYTRTVDTLVAYRCGVIGLDFGYDDWEYPLWAMLREHGISRPEVFFVNLDSARTGKGAAAPVEAIISTHTGRNDTLQYNQARFVKIMRMSPLTVYLRH